MINQPYKCVGLHFIQPNPRRLKNSNSGFELMRPNKLRNRRYRTARITRQKRALFERLFKQVFHTLPAAARDLLKTIPVAVDDYPTTVIETDWALYTDDFYGLYGGA